MKKLLLLFLSAFSLFGCKDNERGEPQTSENNIDAARNFIRAALDGKFDDARRFMLQDSVNLNYMEVVERSFKNLDQPTRDNYRTASIRILGKTNVNDSTSVVIFANTFKNDPDTLKVLRVGQEWLVDLKYLYQHGLDTFLNKPVNDSIP